MKPSFVVTNDHDGRKVFEGFNLLRIGGKKSGISIRLHRFVAADDIGCFHTHPAHAIRIVLWGGYVEQIFHKETPFTAEDVTFRTCRPGFIGRITPEFEHRVHRLLNGKSSWSFFIRFPYIAKITTRGC